MIRQAVHVAVCLLVLAGSGRAQDWAKKMFKETSHDFGKVARGTKAEYAFTLKNIYEETVHIAGVRSTCGCTTVKIPQPTLKTFETAEIVTVFNTVAFRGPHSSTLSVILDKPFPAEVQLQVYGNVRTDVVIEPGSVQFGSVNQGAPVARRVTIRYAGRSNWKIVDVRSANSNFEVEIGEVQRGAGRVTYELGVGLKPSAPVGYLNSQLILVTNDPSSPRIPLQVEGRIVPEISVTPQALVLGEVRPGAEISKKLLVSSTSRRPFRITSVQCDDELFSFDSKHDSSVFHTVRVSFHAPKKPGEVRRTIHIKTDRGSSEVTLVAHATVVP